MKRNQTKPKPKRNLTGSGMTDKCHSGYSLVVSFGLPNNI